jgi:predicted ester cyclase
LLLLIDAFNRRDSLSLRSLYAPDCQGFSSDNTLQGRDQIIGFFEKYWHAFPDCCIHPNFMVAEGDLVVIHYTFSGTNTRSLGGYPATGLRTQVPCALFTRITEAGISEQYFIWDNLGPRRQAWLASTAEKQIRSETPVQKS